MFGILNQHNRWTDSAPNAIGSSAMVGVLCRKSSAHSIRFDSILLRSSRSFSLLFDGILTREETKTPYIVKVANWTWNCGKLMGNQWPRLRLLCFEFNCSIWLNDRGWDYCALNSAGRLHLREDILETVIGLRWRWYWIFDFCNWRHIFGIFGARRRYGVCWKSFVRSFVMVYYSWLYRDFLTSSAKWKSIDHFNDANTGTFTYAK